MSDTLTAATAPLSTRVLDTLAAYVPDLPTVASDAITAHIDEFVRIASPALLASVSRETLFDDIVRFLAGKGVATAGWNDYRARLMPAMTQVQRIMTAARPAMFVPDGYRVITTDEPIPVGTKMRLYHPCATSNGGSVYFDPSVIEVESIAYYTNDTMPDVRVKRLDGSGPEDQSVGRAFLYLPVVPGTTEMPQAPYEIRSNHPVEVRALTAWVEDGVRDVKGGVDEQMSAWGDRSMWPTDSCGTTGVAKDWASALMKAKCERNGWPFPVEDDEPEGVTRTMHDAVRAERDSLAAEVARLRDWQTKAVTDSETISEVYNSEADRRNWCSEADEITDAINSRLQVLSLETRERDEDVTVSGWIRVPFTYSVSVSVTRGDDAEDKAADYWNDGNVSTSDIRNYGSLDWYSAEVEDDLEYEAN
jgi:hypothetical protein